MHLKNIEHLKELKAQKMTEPDKELKIEFAPGCFDNFEGTQEELDELVAEIQKMFEGKSREEIEAQSREITEEDWDELSEDAKLRIISAFDDEDDDTPKRKLQ